MKRVLTILFLSIVTQSLLAQYVRDEEVKKAISVLDSRGEVHFSFLLPVTHNLDYLTRIISIDNVRNDSVFAYANRDEFNRFLKFGYDFEVLGPTFSQGEIRMGIALKGIYDGDTYPTYEEYLTMMYQFETGYPGLCKIYSLDTTVEGRKILYARISDSVMTDEAEPGFMYSSTMHGDELTGYVLMLRLIDYLLSNYGIDSRLTRLVDSLDIWINPLANPDGTYAAGNDMVAGATRGNANNVDLNRNFPDPEDGQHPDGYPWQREVTALMNFTDTISFVMAANFHGGAEVVNYPWDTWQRIHADDAWFQAVSRQYADSAQENSPAGYMTDLNNGITNGYAWYSISGGRQDFMTYFRRCRETTIELSETKLPSSDLLPDFWDYNRESFIGYMENCLKGIYGKVQDIYGNPVYAEIKVVNHDVGIDQSTVFSGPQGGDFYRLLLPGTYDIMISASGYLSDTLFDVVVGDQGRTFLNVTLTIPREYILTGVVRDRDYSYPVQDAKVHVTTIEITPVYTNAEGRYFLSGMYPGNYQVKVSKPNYVNYIADVLLLSTDTIQDFVLGRTDAISFEYGEIDTLFTFSGNEPWVIDSFYYYEGYYSISSGFITNNQTSVISVNQDVIQADSVSFYKRLSCEQNFDFLRFYINDTLQAEWSGYEDWSKEVFAVREGYNTYTWEYVKDPNNSFGLDRVWIDFIELPPSSREYTSLGGYVTDAQAGDSLSNATIEIYADSNYSATTDIHGYFHFEEIYTDIYYGKVYAEDYDTLTGFIQAGQSDSMKSFQLFRLVNLTGRVMDIVSDSVIGNAEIGLKGKYTYSIETDPQGGYRINHFPQGTYNVSALKSGYEPYASYITVSLNDTVHEFELVPIYTLSFETPWDDSAIHYSGDAEWYRDSSESCGGSFAFRSGEIDDSAHSSFTIGPVDLLADGTITFYRKVSSEEVWDVLEFYSNDTLVSSWSGALDWEKVVYPVLHGKNSFTWMYTKDDKWSYGLDAAWIDNITIPFFNILDSSNDDDLLPEKGFIAGIIPNPVKSELNILIKMAETSYTLIHVYDISGNLLEVYTFDELTRGIHEVAIPFSSYKQGVYICKIKTRFGVTNKKFVKIE